MVRYHFQLILICTLTIFAFYLHFLDAVLKTHTNAKESEIQRATMLWFSHAQDRLRAKKPNV